MATWKVTFTRDNITKIQEIKWIEIYLRNKKLAKEQIKQLQNKGYICHMSILPVQSEIIEY
jgi:hypothetical protein